MSHRITASLVITEGWDVIYPQIEYLRSQGLSIQVDEENKTCFVQVELDDTAPIAPLGEAHDPTTEPAPQPAPDPEA